MISVGGDDGDGGVCPDPDNMTLDFNHPVYTYTTRQFMLWYRDYLLKIKVQQNDQIYLDLWQLCLVELAALPSQIRN